MFDIGFGEMLILGAIALIVIGPKDLPGIARKLGRTINDFKKVFSDAAKETTGGVAKEFHQIKQQIEVAEKGVNASLVQKVKTAEPANQKDEQKIEQKDERKDERKSDV